ncbi:hypothetical protein CBM2633_U10008 [Cupriavidus taiwanensis]|nr:hypothetical protein CBM2633_U10008 [Cupriavidus taiwanensis]
MPVVTTASTSVRQVRYVLHKESSLSGEIIGTEAGTKSEPLPARPLQQRCRWVDAAACIIVDAGEGEGEGEGDAVQCASGKGRQIVWYVSRLACLD